MKALKGNIYYTNVVCTIAKEIKLVIIFNSFIQDIQDNFGDISVQARLNNIW